MLQTDYNAELVSSPAWRGYDSEYRDYVFVNYIDFSSAFLQRVLFTRNKVTFNGAKSCTACCAAAQHSCFFAYATVESISSVTPFCYLALTAVRGIVLASIFVPRSPPQRNTDGRNTVHSSLSRYYFRAGGCCRSENGTIHAPSCLRCAAGGKAGKPRDLFFPFFSLKIQYFSSSFSSARRSKHASSSAFRISLTVLRARSGGSLLLAG